MLPHASHFAGATPPVNKKQRGPRREAFAVDKCNETQTDPEQRLFWQLRQKHSKPSCSPNYNHMAADFNLAFVNQMDLVQHQVRLPHLFSMSAFVGVLNSNVSAYPCMTVR